MTGSFRQEVPGTVPDGVGLTFTGLPLDLGDAQGPQARVDAFRVVSGVLGVPVIVTRQVHGAEVFRASAPEGVHGLVDHTDVAADAIVTTQRGLGVAVRVADCVPILIADRGAGVVAAVHAGRAGLLAGVVGSAVDTMRELGGLDLVAWIGPHVCAACYEVPPQMAQEASERLGVSPSVTRWGTAGIDLGAAARRQLERLGVAVSGVSDACTMTTSDLPSHRRDGGPERAAGIIWLQQ